MSLLDDILKKAKRSLQQEGKELLKQGEKNLKNKLTLEKKRYSFETLPRSAEEMKALPGYDITDPFYVGALTVLALSVFSEKPEEGLPLLNLLCGPQPLNPLGVQQLKDRLMDGKNYIARSYFEGATPKNNYEPTKPYTVEVAENPYSRDNIAEGYLVLYVKSGGADSERPFTLRQKKSTGEWFLFGEFTGLLAGIRIPEAQDPWA